jgi:hypothetical protein
MGSYDNEWAAMLDDDLFPKEDKTHVEEVQSEPARFDCGRLYCPFAVRSDGAGLEHDT